MFLGENIQEDKSLVDNFYMFVWKKLSGKHSCFWNAMVVLYFGFVSCQNVGLLKFCFNSKDKAKSFRTVLRIPFLLFWVSNLNVDIWSLVPHVICLCLRFDNIAIMIQRAIKFDIKSKFTYFYLENKNTSFYIAEENWKCVHQVCFGMKSC